jgi:cyclopropane-fatty-acyl-phospholipid synthase
MTLTPEQETEMNTTRSATGGMPPRTPASSPGPSEALTVAAGPSPRSWRRARRRVGSNRRARRVVEQLLAGIEIGSLELVGPDDVLRRYGDPRHPLTARIEVRDPQFYARLLHGASVGLGESYVRGEWVTPDLVALIRLLIANRPALRRIGPAGIASTVVDRLAHLARGNRPGRARRNIVAHYDLSNELYQAFLDPSMTYSAARFEHPGQDLAAAQRTKLIGIAEKARLGPGVRLLEIGCGWGAFSVLAAREYGCSVTAITLSEAQFTYVRDLVEREGLGERIEVLLTDYRDLDGTFDRIVSIEMLEAVGHRYLGTYFRQVDRLLAPDGIAVVQVITLPDQRERAYRARPDFIQRAIFPGGHLPSLTSMSRAMTRNSRLVVEHLENIGTHYAETLRHWRERFRTEEARVRALGFDDTFVRLWEFYLGYCEGAFLSRYLNDLQLVLTRTGNGVLGTSPYSVAHAPLSERDQLVAGR